MSYELDHVYVLVAPGAPEAASLEAVGLRRGAGRRHPGQGTANSCFFFEHGMLELLWIEDEAAARSHPAAGLRLADRWHGRSSGASPFGIGFRGRAPTAVSPFPAWRYRPGYLPAGRSILVGDNAGVIAEPLVFHLPWLGRPMEADPVRRQPAGMPRRISALRVSGAWRRESEVLGRAAATGVVALRAGEAPLMELHFDDDAGGRSHDFRPTLPLHISW